MSFLSPPQQYLLAVLNETRCLRKRQAAALLHRKFGVSQAVVNAIIRQLRAIGRVREYEDTISLVGPGYPEAMLQAVDLVLAVFPREAPQLIHAQPPFVLAAVIEKKGHALSSNACANGKRSGMLSEGRRSVTI